jgi:V/A-type H+-transporting ATPase subunit K
VLCDFNVQEEKRMKRRIVFFVLVLLVLGSAFVCAQEAAPAQPQQVWKYFAAALAVGISCIAGGIAVGQIGAAAMGAMSENPDLAGKALPYAGLAEGICLWGFLVALLILVVN